MPEMHAVLACSASHRWIPCPGSIKLSKQCETPKGSEYAEEGTRAHALAEAKLLRFLGKISPKDYQQTVEYAAPDGEMEEATDLYVDRVEELLNGSGEGAYLMVEQQFTLDKWVPEGFGTSDAVIISDDKIEVIDLKYGKGVKVDAPNNSQLRLYGLGAYDLFDGLGDFQKVRMTIIQPRLDHVSTEELDVNDLLTWAEEVVKPAAKAAYDGTGPVEPGEWCRWCPAKAVCRKRAEANLELAKHDFKAADLLTAEELGEVLSKAEELQKWVSDVQAYALEQAVAGENIEGWKIVEGRSVRTISDIEAAVKALKAAGVADEAIYKPQEVNGITALEKTVGKKKLTELIGKLITKPPGKPVLVPESDKRAAINTAEAAKADFKED